MRSGVVLFPPLPSPCSYVDLTTTSHSPSFSWVWLDWRSIGRDTSACTDMRRYRTEGTMSSGSSIRRRHSQAKKIDCSGLVCPPLSLAKSERVCKGHPPFSPHRTQAEQGPPWEQEERKKSNEQPKEVIRKERRGRGKSRSGGDHDQETCTIRLNVPAVWRLSHAMMFFFQFAFP